MTVTERLSPWIRRCLWVALLVPAMAHAVWYEAEGTARIYDGDAVDAKQRAVKNAVENALMFAGVSVSSVQEIAAGELLQASIQIRSEGTLRDVRVVSETRNADRYSVTVHADILAHSGECDRSAYRKVVTLGDVRLLRPLDAQVGQLSSIGSAVRERLAIRLTERGQHLTLQQEPDSRLRPYTISGQLSDLSMQDAFAHDLLRWASGDPKRNFELLLTVTDPNSGYQLLQKRFNAQAPWDFDKYEAVDPHSRQFWQSAFGEAVDRQLERAVGEIDAQLACQRLEGVISQIDGEHLFIELGSAHGIQPFDRLIVAKHKEISMADGSLAYVRVPTRLELQIEHVEAFHSTATVKKAEMLAGIKPGDWVIQR